MKNFYFFGFSVKLYFIILNKLKKNAHINKI